MKAMVRVRISGLCMFVPDPEHGAMQVLMPKADGHGGHARHYAAIVYDTAHEQATSAAFSKCYRRIGVDERRIVVRTAPRSPIDYTLDRRHVLRLGRAVCFDGVDPRYKGDGEAGAKLTARVTLRSGDAAYCHMSDDGAHLFCTDRDGGYHPARYTIDQPCPTGEDAGPDEQYMAFAVLWRVGEFDAPVRLGDLLSVHPLNGRGDEAASALSSADAERVLHPIDGRIDLRIMHVVDGELPDAHCVMADPSGNGTAHFKTYYDMAERPHDEPRPVPQPLDFFAVGATCAVVQASFPS